MLVVWQGVLFLDHGQAANPSFLGSFHPPAGRGANYFPQRSNTGLAPSARLQISTNHPGLFSSAWKNMRGEGWSCFFSGFFSFPCQRSLGGKRFFPLTEGGREGHERLPRQRRRMSPVAAARGDPRRGGSVMAEVSWRTTRRCSGGRCG